MNSDKVYLIDKDFFFAKTFMKKLGERADYNMEYFESFEDALGPLSNEKPSIVLIEHELDGKSGLEAIPLIRKAHPSVEIVMISNQNDINVVDQAYANGVSKYFRKDILLLDHIEGFIKQRKVAVPSWKKLFA